MKTRHFSSTLWKSFSLLATLALTGTAARAQAPAEFPEGLTDFAGRAARNHWCLFGDEAGGRVALDDLNRQLREAKRQWDTGRDEASRQAAWKKAEPAAERLIRRVQENPNRARIDLNAKDLGLSWRRPFELPGDTGAILFEVVTGDAGVHLKTQSADMAEMPEATCKVLVDRLRDGTNYVLLGLEHVPFGRTTVDLEVRSPGRTSVHLPLELTTPAAGQLRLTVLSADTGKPIPAMVTLKWHTDGLVRRPGNGVEYAPQMDGQGIATGMRTPVLPAGQAQPGWCMPGPVKMSLSPGRWSVTARRGVEHEIVTQEVEIRPGQTTVCTVRPKRWVDMRQHGWWSGDDHVHCQLLSDDDARRLMFWVQAEDIHFANVVKMGDIYRTYFEQRGFGRDFRVVDGEHVLVPGQECPRTHDQLGHTLAMNITNMVRNTNRYFLYDEVFDAVHAQGGLTGYAHAGSGLFYVHRDMSLNVPRQKADFAEILQFNKLGTDLYYDFLNLGCKLTASAGSDVPWGGTIGEVRAYAYLGRARFSADAWLDAFRRGRTFTSSGPMLEFRVDDALPGDEIQVRGNRPLRVRAQAWGDPSRAGEVTLEIVRHGEVIRSTASAEARPAQAKLDFTVDPGNGCWIAARARAADGTFAHTTPIYVVREGLRFWKYAALEGLFARRLASLDEIEQIIAEARRLDAEGKLSADRYRKQLALQGDELQQRVTQARAMYDNLRKVAEAELPRRRTAP